MDKTTKIAVCSRSFSRHPILRQELLENFSRVKFNDQGISLKGQELVDFLADADGAVIALEVVDAEILQQLPNLKFVGKYGVGLDKLDFDAFEKYDVKLGWTPGVNAQGVTELTLAMALNAVRQISISHNLVRSGTWKQVSGTQLSSKTYGILGCGHVGKIMVKLLQPFGCKILAHDILEQSEYYARHGVESVSLADLLSYSDVMSIHVPHNDSTHMMLGRTNLTKMKKGAVLINTARGGIVDEEALLEALNTEQLSAIAFDVLEREPPQDRRLIEHPRAYVTSHIGGSSQESILAMGRAAIEGLKEFYPANTFARYK